MENKKALLRLIEIYFDAFAEIVALQDFCKRNLGDLDKIEKDIYKKYIIGKKIYDALIPVLATKNNDDKIKKIERAYQQTILGNTKLRDMCKVYIFEEEDSVNYEMNPEYRGEKYDPNIAVQKYNNLYNNQKIFAGAVLSNIIIIFESAMSKILKILYCNNPILYFQNRTMPIAAACNNYEKSIINEVEKAINNDMYESIKVFNLLKRNENIDINRYDNLKKTFEEIYYRRNSFVHNNGRINKQYLDKVDSAFSSKLKKGDMFICDLNYFNNAMECVSKIIFTVVFCLIEKNKNIDDNIIKKIDKKMFQNLKDEKYNLCQFPYHVLSQFKNLLEKYKMMFLINYLICKKQLGIDIKEEAKNIDTSAKDEQFKIAKECLLGNNEQVMKKLEEIYPKHFPVTAIKEWPIFIDFRKSEYYKHFVSNHKSDFEKNTIELKNDSQNEQL